MEQIIKKLNNYKVLLTLIAFFIGGMWTIFNQYQIIKDNNKEMLATIKTTQQMALKSVIWNDEIPIGERASACDVYLNAGYNSLTKKECGVIIEEGALQGIFSYVD